jgi:hypothetical protein
MASITTIVEERPLRASGIAVTRAVSWQAIVAGAAAAAALSLILFMLGIGLGLSAVSPWTNFEASAGAITTGAILWITCVACASSGLGGYLAGRLRESWPGVQRDEVYFRDTAHGFLAWALATLVTAGVLASVMGTLARSAVPLAAAATPTSAGSTGEADWTYAVDALFRIATPADAAQRPVESSAPDDTRAREEIARIFTTSQAVRTMTPEDVRHVGQLLSQHRGYMQPEAEERAAGAFNAELARREKLEQKAVQLAEVARHNAARASLWIFVSLLLGAFIASLMATFGGRQRDLP